MILVFRRERLGLVEQVSWEERGWFHKDSEEVRRLERGGGGVDVHILGG